MSSLADRIKIARLTNSTAGYSDDGVNVSLFDISLSIQFILNCGASIAGSCHGGKFLEVSTLPRRHVIKKAEIEPS